MPFPIRSLFLILTLEFAHEAQDLVSHPLLRGLAASVLAVCSVGVAAWLESDAVCARIVRQPHRRVLWNGCRRLGRSAARIYPHRERPRRNSTTMAGCG